MCSSISRRGGFINESSNRPVHGQRGRIPRRDPGEGVAGRYQHSRNVAKAALKLAERNGADLEKAYVCGLLHDVEKNAPKEEQKRYMKQLGETLPQYVFDNPKLWHAPAGAAYVRDELGIVDEEMIHAIKYHTTGRPGMTVLERIIYVADFISDERDYPGVEKVRETAYRNLDEAILIGSQFTLPVSWQLSTLREYEENQAIYSNQQAISIAEENCLRFFEKLLEKGVQIIEKNVRIDMIGKECVAEGIVTVIGPIAQSVPIAENTVHQEETNN